MFTPAAKLQSLLLWQSSFLFPFNINRVFIPLPSLNSAQSHSCSPKGCREIWRNMCVLILAVCHPGSHWRLHYYFSMARAGHMGGDVFIIISCRELVRVSSFAAKYV